MRRRTVMRQCVSLLTLSMLGLTGCGWLYMGAAQQEMRRREEQKTIQAVEDLRRIYEEKGAAALASTRQSEDFWRYPRRRDDLPEFFVAPQNQASRHPPDDCNERDVQAATAFQALMAEMEAHPGTSAGTWGKFRDKVRAYWTQRDGIVRFPVGVEAVLTLYARVSGAEMNGQADLHKR